MYKFAAILRVPAQSICLRPIKAFPATRSAYFVSSHNKTLQKLHPTRSYADMSHQTHPQFPFRVRRHARYGWKPDLPDARDHLFSAPRMAMAVLPSKVDLSSGCPPVYDQGQLGSCTGNAIAGAFEFLTKKQKLEADFTPSRLFIYYNERAMEGTVSTDAGAQIRDGIKSVAKLGVCPETLWPYDTTPADPKTEIWPANAKAGQRPPANCYTSALTNLAVSYQRVNRNLDQMRACLSAGFPFVIGFTVYDSFESQQVATTGIMPMPGQGDEIAGGHAVLVVGYDDSKKAFFVRNSWGTGWGLKGYFWMPYTYLMESSLSSDFWTIRVVT